MYYRENNKKCNAKFSTCAHVIIVALLIFPLIKHAEIFLAKGVEQMFGKIHFLSAKFIML